jgi:hypothetical protein
MAIASLKDLVAFRTKIAKMRLPDLQTELENLRKESLRFRNDTDKERVAAKIFEVQTRINGY